MGPLDALLHLLNFFLPGLAVGMLSAAMAKQLWRRRLVGLPWHTLAAWASVACIFISLGGLAVTGHDGAMATYGVMVAGCALTLWWIGFLRRR